MSKCRSIPKCSPLKTTVLYSATVLVLLMNTTQGRREDDTKTATFLYRAVNCRKHGAILTEFGTKGDGNTLNTKAFKSVVKHLSRFASNGGAQLIIPSGKWLTCSFSLISHFTLWLNTN